MAAVVTFIKTPNIKANYNATSGILSQLLDQIERSKGLLVERPWFGYDKMSSDDFSDRVKSILFNPDDIMEELKRIRLSGARTVHAIAAYEEDKEDVLAELKRPATTFNQIDISNTADPVATLTMQVPYMKLQRFLIKAYKATESRGSAQMTKIKIASSPRIAPSAEHMEQFFSPET